MIDMIDVFYLFLYGDDLKEYPGWTKHGNAWIWEIDEDGR